MSIMPTLGKLPTIKIADKKFISKRMGHINVKHSVIRDAVDAGRVCTIYAKMGKPACRCAHQDFVEELV